MPKWTFCRKCGWHSAGEFSDCPACDSKNVKIVDTSLPPADAKGSDFYPAKEEAG